MTIKKMLCSDIKCESLFFEPIIVKKDFIRIRCLCCGKITQIHRTHLNSLFGSDKTISGFEIKEAFSYDLEEEE